MIQRKVSASVAKRNSKLVILRRSGQHLATIGQVQSVLKLGAVYSESRALSFQKKMPITVALEVYVSLFEHSQFSSLYVADRSETFHPFLASCQSKSD